MLGWPGLNLAPVTRIPIAPRLPWCGVHPGWWCFGDTLSNFYRQDVLARGLPWCIGSRAGTRTAWGICRRGVIGPSGTIEGATCLASICEVWGGGRAMPCLAAHARWVLARAPRVPECPGFQPGPPGPRLRGCWPGRPLGLHPGLLLTCPALDGSAGPLPAWNPNCVPAAPAPLGERSNCGSRHPLR